MKIFVSILFSTYLLFLSFYSIYKNGCIWSIINDFTTTLTLLQWWKMTVIEKCMWCILFENRGIELTYAYINTIINYQENNHSTHFFSLKFHYRRNGHYRWYKFSFSQLCHVCVLHPSRWKLSIQFQIFNLPPILGAALSIATWIHDLSCDDSSASVYGEPLRYTKPFAFHFMPEYTWCILVYFI